MAQNAGCNTSPSFLLHNKSSNKGTAFTQKEREKLRLRGLLPPRVENIEQQAKRCMLQLQAFEKPINKYIHLLSLKDRNENLFYYVLMNNLESLLPIVYTPTVGEACIKFASIWRLSQGMYFCSEDRGHFSQMLDNWVEDVDIIVVTDGSRILGLGDLGTNGMGIPIGKLSLYVAGAGFHPSRTLPVVLDVGTNNSELLTDPLYLGTQHPRLPDKDYYELVEEFMISVKERWPKALVQFEDFSNDHCFDLLDKYRNRQLCFNDDIQGTGAVIAAGFVNAVKLSGVPVSEHKFVFFGAGSAGVGVADCIVQIIQEYGFTEEEARRKFYLVDTKGLVTTHRGDTLQHHKLRYARTEITHDLSTLLDVINFVKPTGLIGLAGAGRAFTPEILQAVAQHSKRPIVFALSNPTSKSECTAEEAYQHTDGRCIFASGSPFAPVTLNGKVYVPGQGNNMFIFPGLGFGAFLSQAKKVSDGMIIAASKTLAECVTQEELDAGLIYPNVNEIRHLSLRVAVAVISKAFEEGLSQLPSKPENLEAFVKEHMYQPHYTEQL